MFTAIVYCGLSNKLKAVFKYVACLYVYIVTYTICNLGKGNQNSV